MPSTSKLEASRFVSYHLSLEKEMWERFLPEGYFAVLGRVVEDPFLTKQQVIELLGREKFPALGFAFSADHFEVMEVKDKRIVKPLLPVVEIQPFAVRVSEGKLLEKDFGVGSMYVGASVSYPTLAKVDGEVVFTKDHFEEAKTFAGWRKWIRKETTPGIISAEGVEYRGTFRVGKQ
ncbi:hypothetical protein K0U07_03680 [bacterium]|nr:hypothetical protein [bacterium]